MTAAEFKAARESLFTAQKGLADEWGVAERTIRKWENGERPLNPIAAYCIALMSARSFRPANKQKSG